MHRYNCSIETNIVKFGIREGWISTLVAAIIVSYKNDRPDQYIGKVIARIKRNPIAEIIRDLNFKPFTGIGIRQWHRSQFVTIDAFTWIPD